MAPHALSMTYSFLYSSGQIQVNTRVNCDRLVIQIENKMRLGYIILK